MSGGFIGLFLKTPAISFNKDSGIKMNQSEWLINQYVIRK